MRWYVRVPTWVGIANSGPPDSGIMRLWQPGDIAEERAEERANQAQEFQGGTKPAVYTELDDMLAKHPDLECVDHLRTFTVPTTHSPYLHWKQGSMLSLKSRSVSQCGHAN